MCEVCYIEQEVLIIALLSDRFRANCRMLLNNYATLTTSLNSTYTKNCSMKCELAFDFKRPVLAT